MFIMEQDAHAGFSPLSFAVSRLVSVCAFVVRSVPSTTRPNIKESTSFMVEATENFEHKR